MTVMMLLWWWRWWLWWCYRGQAWAGGVKMSADKHARDISFLDKYALERWEVGCIVFLFGGWGDACFFIRLGKCMPIGISTQLSSQYAPRQPVLSKTNHHILKWEFVCALVFVGESWQVLVVVVMTVTSQSALLLSIHNLSYWSLMFAQSANTSAMSH